MDFKPVSEENIPYFRTKYDWDIVENPITDEEVREWITELRSGNFKQAQEVLKSEDILGTCYCCLGVLQEIQNLEIDPERDSELLVSMRWEDGIKESYYIKLPSALQGYLAGLNDEQNYTFEQIADVLEKGFNLR
jgi:hypothetical protein